MSIHPKIRRVASCAHLWRTPAGSFPLPILVQILLELAELALVIQLVPVAIDGRREVLEAFWHRIISVSVPLFKCLIAREAQRDSSNG